MVRPYFFPAAKMFFVFAAAFAAACSSGESERYPTPDSFCAALASEVCAGVAGPCAVSLEKCTSAAKGVCLAGGTGRTYQSARAEICVNKTREVFSARTIDPSSEQAQKGVCDRVFVGTSGVNAACKQSADCNGELICDAAFGLCATPASRNLNDPCNNPGDACVAGTFCTGMGAALKVCVGRGHFGDSCSVVPCLEDLRCSGTCQAKLDPQAPCTGDDDCPSTAASCDSVQGKCLPKYSVGSVACGAYGG